MNIFIDTISTFYVLLGHCALLLDFGFKLVSANLYMIYKFSKVVSIFELNKAY